METKIRRIRWTHSEVPEDGALIFDLDNNTSVYISMDTEQAKRIVNEVEQVQNL